MCGVRVYVCSHNNAKLGRLLKKRICQQRLRKIKVEFVVFTMRAKIGSVILGHSLERPALSWK